MEGMNILSTVADACIMFYAFPATYQIGSLPVELFGAHFIAYNRTSAGYIAHNKNGTNTFNNPYQFGTSNSRYCPIGIYIFKED